MKGKQILFGITGDAQAIEAVSAVRRLVETGAQVRVILTQEAQRFVPEQELAALTGAPVVSAMFHSPAACTVDHITLGEWAQRFIVAPLAPTVAKKLALGLADDMLTTTALVVRAPRIVWARPGIADADMAALKALDYLPVEPEYLESVSKAICRTACEQLKTPYSDRHKIRPYLEEDHEA